MAMISTPFSTPVLGGVALLPGSVLGGSPFGYSAPVNPALTPQQFLPLLQATLSALVQLQQGWGVAGGAQFAAPQVPAPTGSGTTGGGASAVKSPVQDLQRYIDAVDNSGGVDSNKLGVGTVGEYQARNSVVNGYAAEFYAGGRLNDAASLGKYQDALYSDLSGQNGPAGQDAATFALVASRFKNANGQYSKNELVRVLKATGNGDLVTSGVGSSDVTTLSAVTAAIKSGKLSLSQLFDPQTGKDVLGGTSIQISDKDLYNRAIKSVTGNPPNLGSAIENGDAGPARTDLLSFLGGSKSGNGVAGNAGNAGNGGNAGNSGGGGGGLLGGLANGLLGGASDVLTGLVNTGGEMIGGLAKTILPGEMGNTVQSLVDVATDTVNDTLILGVKGKVEEAVGLVDKVASGDIGGALQGAMSLVVDTPQQLVTVLGGKLENVTGILGDAYGGGSEAPASPPAASNGAASPIVYGGYSPALNTGGAFDSLYSNGAGAFSQAPASGFSSWAQAAALAYT